MFFVGPPSRSGDVSPLQTSAPARPRAPAPRLPLPSVELRSQSMNLQELKKKSPSELLSFAEELQIENASSLRKQDMMFAILKQLAENDVPIS
ncbi:Rho termination factor N-terminal domain-containing protein, partial [Leclercia adecarboxylata]|uniref:Rho termination factor N-terminal domain-containing protein n=1 Tax=Leclercia adecarboxylata TaxID=83655 RepID=UPI0028C4874F